MRRLNAREVIRIVGLGVVVPVAIARLLILTLGYEGVGDGNETLIPPNGVFRLLRVGDTWTYEATLTITSLTTGEQYSATGTARVEIEPTGTQGVWLEKLTLSVELPDRTTMTKVEGFALSQDSNGTIYLVGIFTPSGIERFQSPIVVYQSPMEVGQVVRTSEIPGIARSYRVEALEKVSVPAGTWVAFKVVGSAQFRDAFGQPISSTQITEWIVPSLGRYIKRQVTKIDHKNGNLEATTYSLKTYRLNP